MLLRGRFRYQQKNEQRDRLVIRRIKADGARQLQHGCHGRLQAFDASVRNGHAVPQARGTQALAGEKAVGNQRAREAMQALEQQARLLKGAFFAGDIRAHEHA